MNICDFMVWTQTDTITRRIKKDEPFLKEKLRKAELFFMNYLLPELICRYQDPQLAKEISSLHCEQPSDMINSVQEEQRENEVAGKSKPQRHHSSVQEEQRENEVAGKSKPQRHHRMNESVDPRTTVCVYVYTVWNAVYVLLVPVFGAVIFVGCQQWRKPQSSNRVDLFTFNLAALDMIGVVGACLLTASSFRTQTAERGPRHAGPRSAPRRGWCTRLAPMDASDSMANGSSSVDCFRDPPTFYIFISIAVVTLLLMPVSLYILYLGFSQWKQRRAASHLDHFTYHMSAMDLLPFCGCIVFCVGACYDNIFLMSQSLALFSFNWSAKIHLNTLTCVDRYLAVVHPISYLNLKRRAGVKIRNGAIAFLWLLGLACISLLSACSSPPQSS
uniref:G-protein coupled receptors family 1 profile domain-containing protein n=1 Tax=Knipowitschia caucasica TaxID=637954 RepID=A0AAV2KS97_KNICA